MTNLFISPDSDIKVEFWIAYTGGRFLNWTTEAEMKASDFAQKNADQITRVEAHFREPNFKDTSEVADLALAMESDGSFSMSINQVRMERLIRLIKSWNLKDSEGADVPPTRSRISQLHPTVAQLLMLGLEERLGLNDPTDGVQATS